MHYRCSPPPQRLMLILFDNGTPAPLRHALKGHVVVEAIERGWDRLLNGELIATAEAAGFELLVTTDKNMRYQQDLKGRKIAFVVIAISNGPLCAGTLIGLWPPSMQRLPAVMPKWTYRSSKPPSLISASERQSP